MNCVRWSMGDASLHGMGTSWVPGQCFGCYPCPRTKLLPMSPDRTDRGLTNGSSSPADAGCSAVALGSSTVDRPDSRAEGAMKPGKSAENSSVVRAYSKGG